MKEILEYTGSTHQLRRWSQELLGYKFAIIYRDASMMKDIDGLSRHINALVHRYLIQAHDMRLVYIEKRPFAYSFESFISCSIPRRVTFSDSTITTEANSTLSPLSTIHYFPIHFTSSSILQLYSVSKTFTPTFHHIVPPEDIIWLSFDSITTSFGSLLSLWHGGTITDLRFEIDLHHHRIASYFSKSTLPQYTAFSHLLHHFNLFKNNCSSSHLETQKQCVHHDRYTRTLTSGLTTDVASLQKKNGFDNLASGLTTDVVYLRKKDVLDKLISCLTTDVASLRKKVVLDKLVLCLTTDVASLRKKDVLDKLASLLTIGVSSLCKKDVLDKLVSCLTTDAVSLRK